MSPGGKSAPLAATWGEATARWRPSRSVPTRSHSSGAPPSRPSSARSGRLGQSGSHDPARSWREWQTRRPPPRELRPAAAQVYRTPRAARPRRSAVNRCGAGVFPGRARLAGEAGTESTPRSTAVKALAGCPRSEGRDLAAGPGQHLVVGGEVFSSWATVYRPVTCARRLVGRVACDANERRSRPLDGLLVLRVLLIFRQFVDRRPADVI